MDWNSFFLALIGLITALSTVLNQIAARNAALAQREAEESRKLAAKRSEEVKDTLKASTDSTNRHLDQLHQGQRDISNNQESIKDTGNKIHILVNNATSVLLKDKVRLALENLEKAKLIVELMQMYKSAGASEVSSEQADASLKAAEEIYRVSVEASDKHEAKQRKVDEM